MNLHQNAQNNPRQKKLQEEAAYKESISELGGQRLYPQIEKALRDLSDVSNNSTIHPDYTPQQVARNTQTAIRVNNYLNALRLQNPELLRRSTDELARTLAPQSPEVAMQQLGMTTLFNVRNLFRSDKVQRIQKGWPNVESGQLQFIAEPRDADDPTRAYKQNKRIQKKLKPMVEGLRLGPLDPNDNSKVTRKRMGKTIRKHPYFFTEDHIVRINVDNIDAHLAIIEGNGDEDGLLQMNLTPDGRNYIMDVRAALLELRDADNLSRTTQPCNQTTLAEADPAIQEAVHSVRILVGLIALAMVAIHIPHIREKLAKGETPIVPLVYLGIAIAALYPGKPTISRELAFTHTARWDTVITHPAYFGNTDAQGRRQFIYDLTTKPHVKKRIREFFRLTRRNPNPPYENLINMLEQDGHMTATSIQILRRMREADVASGRFSNNASHLHFMLSNCIMVTRGESRTSLASFAGQQTNARSYQALLARHTQADIKERRQRGYRPF